MAERRAEQEAQAGSRVTVLALDRWGKVLTVEREGTGGPPSTPLREGESPDAAALRVFEELTGALLDELHLFRDETPGHHHYYCDPDLAIGELEPAAGASLRYVGPDDLTSASLTDEARALLERFIASSAYRALFH